MFCYYVLFYLIPHSLINSSIKKKRNQLRIFYFFFIIVLFSTKILFANTPNEINTSKEAVEYRIDQPGTITFTVGLVIKGKVEKPQVVIFLPKEKTYYRDIEFDFSFDKDVSTPLPFIPIIE